MKSDVKKNLKLFLEKYNKYKESLKDQSEQTMRSWIDEFLMIFGWDCKNPTQVQQEKMVNKNEKNKLKKIDSTHVKPDYTLKNGKVRLNFLDAKDLSDNIRLSKEIAFQARSYGWSAGMTCSIVTNIEEIAFYSCHTTPHKDDNADSGRIYFTVQEYLDNFDTLFNLLYRENVINNIQESIFNESFSEVTKVDLDSSFAEFLSEFRYKLAENIYINNKNIIRDNETLNTILQTIINRIIFIRICEGRELEEKNILLKLIKKDFWQEFKKKCSDDYNLYYDGPIFKKNNLLDEIKIDKGVFDNFIQNLYDLSPYKFDVIPVELMASMYEKLLATEIDISTGIVLRKEKEFYVKQQGAISTPKYMVEFVLKETFQSLPQVNSLKDLLDIKVLDPACGSGTFVIEIVDMLEEKAIELYKKGCIKREEKNLFIEIENNIFTSVELRRMIIKECIYAIDMDYQAIEVAKISLSLKLIDNYQLPAYNEKFGLCRKLLLKEIGNNIMHGNTLVGMNIVDQNEGIDVKYLEKLVPLDIELYAKPVFDKKKGFDFIVGNPPYVETKNYIDALPYCREYFKKNYKFDDQKADMSIYFIEKCLTLLNMNGKLGFICQKRFFKTDYGKNTRNFIIENRMLEKIVDFGTEKIFKGRTNYVALMIFNKNINEKYKYLNIREDANVLENKLIHVTDREYNIKTTRELINKRWNFTDEDRLQALIDKLSNKYQSLDSLIKKDICDIHGGIQVLRNDVYYINDFIINEELGLISGKNRRKEKLEKDVLVEIDMCRPIIANRGLIKFQELKPNYYAIVPYTLEGTQPINFDELMKKYPKCAQYLNRNRRYIEANNKELLKDNRWHLFTRTTNINKYYEKKIMFPMTAKEVVASFISQPCYPDNSNMWYMNFKEEDDNFYRAITAILNSKLFSVMAIYYSNPQANNYKKMNKQFIRSSVIPYDKVKANSNIVNKLNELATEIEKLVNKKNINTDGASRINKQLINNKFLELNRYVNQIYELSSEEEQMINEMYDTFLIN